MFFNGLRWWLFIPTKGISIGDDCILLYFLFWYRHRQYIWKKEQMICLLMLVGSRNFSTVYYYLEERTTQHTVDSNRTCYVGRSSLHHLMTWIANKHFDYYFLNKNCWHQKKKDSSRSAFHSLTRWLSWSETKTRVGQEVEVKKTT